MEENKIKDTRDFFTQTIEELDKRFQRSGNGRTVHFERGFICKLWQVRQEYDNIINEINNPSLQPAKLMPMKSDSRCESDSFNTATSVDKSRSAPLRTPDDVLQAGCGTKQKSDLSQEVRRDYTQEKLKKIEDIIIREDINCGEDLWQRDSLNLKLPELMDEICGIVGYKDNIQSRTLESGDSKAKAQPSRGGNALNYSTQELCEKIKYAINVRS